MGRVMPGRGYCLSLGLEHHVLNVELGRHRGREGRKECLLCGDECESVSYVLWECPAYHICRSDFTAKLQDLLGEGFQSLDSQLPLCWAMGGKLFITP